MTSDGLHRVVLVGFMASGKTTVGRHLARALGWRFADMDQAVETAEGMTVAEIFARRGESHFRSVEARVAEALLEESGLVLASGGGWAAHPGRLAGLPSGTVSVWLRVSPEEAVRRARTTAGSRPLLAGPEPLESARRLLAERAAAYASSTLEVDTEAERPEDVSAGILEILARRYPEMTDKRLRSPHAR